MKLPLSWLNDYVKVDDLPVAELAEKLRERRVREERGELVEE